MHRLAIRIEMQDLHKQVTKVSLFIFLDFFFNNTYTCFH